MLKDLLHSAIHHCTELKYIMTPLGAYHYMNILWTYVSALNLIYESQANNHGLVLLLDLLYHRYFQIFHLFCCVKMKTYLNH